MRGAAKRFEAAEKAGIEMHKLMRRRRRRRRAVHKLCILEYVSYVNTLITDLGSPCL
jgi:hypothetical protein